MNLLTLRELVDQYRKYYFIHCPEPERNFRNRVEDFLMRENPMKFTNQELEELPVHKGIRDWCNLVMDSIAKLQNPPATLLLFCKWYKVERENYAYAEWSLEVINGDGYYS